MAAPISSNIVYGGNPAIQVHQDATLSPITLALLPRQKHAPASNSVSGGVVNASPTIFDELIDANIVIAPPWANLASFVETNGNVDDPSKDPVPSAPVMPTAAPVSNDTVNTGKNILN